MIETMSSDSRGGAKVTATDSVEIAASSDTEFLLFNLT